MFNSNASSATGVANYIEEMFQTWLYTGNGSTQTITNGIDLAGKGGMVWVKNRGTAAIAAIVDTVRGAGYNLAPSETSAQALSSTASVQSFLSNGFTVGAGNFTRVNGSGQTYASWTFRDQAKFFDVVTYTGTGANRTIAHNLGSVPGCIIVKRTDTTADWQVYHRSLANTEYMVLNSTAAVATGATRWNSTTPTDTVFSLGTDVTVNASGGTYVAYLFAHDAGGFGLTGTDNVISCGSTDGSKVTLGWEPQWLLYRSLNFTDDWQIVDNMRGLPVGAVAQKLEPNTTDAEAATSNSITIAADGFTLGSISGTAIYIAIRRGPMKVPTTGTSVYNAVTRSGNGSNTSVTGAGFPVGAAIIAERSSNVAGKSVFASRLTGSPYLSTSDTAAETTSTDVLQTNAWDLMDGVKVGTGTSLALTNTSGFSYVNWLFQRAPGFFDEVCYTGNSTANRVLNHNLAVAPELIITKQRSAGSNWNTVYGITASAQNAIILNTNGAGFGPFSYTPGNWILNAAPTSTTITIGSEGAWNNSGQNYVTYLFASCPGVSKVGNYTGTATTQVINCGFTAGSRFVMIKRTDSTGDWYVWDSARGIVAGNDPYLLLNSTAAEVTSTDYVDTAATGFELSSTAPAAINASGGSYIFLAIA